MSYIMVIDDSPTVRTSVEFAIKGMGHAVKQAENGSDAIDKIRGIMDAKDDIKLCIVDVNMPVMDGITFVREFKLDKFTPILVLTTESEANKIKEGKDSGASGWIVKPFLPAELIKVVEKLIK
jgi:two-component system chemotaxis response regulator CheY